MRRHWVLVLALSVALSLGGCQGETFAEREERRAEEAAVQERVRDELAAPAEDEFPYPAPPAFAERSRGKVMVKLSALSSSVISYEVNIPGAGTEKGRATAPFGSRDGATAEFMEVLEPGTVSATVSGHRTGGDVLRCLIIVDGWVVAETGGKHEASCSAQAERQ